MIAVKLQGTVTADHHLDLIIPSSVPPGEVEIILLLSEHVGHQVHQWSL